MPDARIPTTRATPSPDNIVKISGLPVASTINDTDQLEANQGGISRSITVGQIAGRAQATFDLSAYAQLASPIFIGDPHTPTPDRTYGASIANVEFVDTAIQVAVEAIPAPPTSLPPSGPAGGDLSGSYPNPTLRSGVIPAPPTTLPPNGPAGGDLSGSYPNPTIKPSATNGQVMTTVAGVSAWATPSSGGGGIPEAPLDGKQYARQSATWSAVASGGASITVSDTPPASPTAGALWWNSVLGTMFIYYNDGNSMAWVPAAPSSSLGPAATQDGVLRLYSEQVLTVAANVMAVNFPASAKLVELVWDAIVTPQSDPTFSFQGMIAGTPVTTSSYTTSRFVASAPSGGTTNGGDVTTGTAWSPTGGFSYRGRITFTNPSQGQGVGQLGSISSAGVRANTMVFLESALTGLNGYRLTCASNNFAIGSYLRCFVVT